MRTYTHGIVGYLLYLKGTAEQRTMAVVGAILPDLLLGIGYIGHLGFKNNIIESIHQLFHRGAIHTVTEIMHSLLITGILLALAYGLFKKYVPFFVGMFSHGVLDLLTHQRSAYNHFMPIPLEPLRAPFSYRGLWFGIIEHIVVVGFIVWLYYRKK